MNLRLPDKVATSADISAAGCYPLMEGLGLDLGRITGSWRIQNQEKHDRGESCANQGRDPK